MSALTRLHDRLRQPPPGPFRPAFWRSPLRGPRPTSMLGSLLLPLIVIIALTGLISQDAYHPELRGNAIIDPARDLGVLIQFLTSGPAWIYALTQGRPRDSAWAMMREGRCRGTARTNTRRDGADLAAVRAARLRGGNSKAPPFPVPPQAVRALLRSRSRRG